jgi:hypothetical protein
MSANSSPTKRLRCSPVAAAGWRAKGSASGFLITYLEF